MAENNVSIPCKVIVVGDSGVGKTSIIKRYLNTYNDKEQATIGASFSSKLQKVGNITLSFDIWDTAGQERFRSVNSIFYKEAYACILVYDITSEESFQSIKNYWIKIVRQNALPEIIFVVAGNKKDLYENSQVKEKDVKEFCKEIDSFYCETSALENEGIEEAFENLGTKFINSPIFKDLKKNYNIDDKIIDLGKKKKKKKKKSC